MTEELHPDARSFLERTAESPPLHELTPEAARATQRETAIPESEPESVAAVHDVVARGAGHGVPLRVYVPETDQDGPLPVLVWAHGGGFVLGDVETEDPLARALANAAACVVVSVDYRLSPEHTFPSALRDVYTATAWARAEADAYDGDPERVGVGGASAGGALAAGLSLLARDDEDLDVDYQVLVYPAVNRDRSFPSMAEHGGLFLTRAEMEWVAKQRFDDPLQGNNPYAHPLLADDVSGLPPATVVIAGFDPLKDAYVQYADRLANAGVDVTRHRYDDMIHSFFGRVHEPEWERAREAVEDVGEDLRDFFG